MIAVIGGSGTIGIHLPTSVQRVNLNLSMSDFNLGLCKSEEVNFLHLAGLVGISKVENNRALAYSINVDGTLKLAEKFLQDYNGVFYFISSSHVYKASNKILHENSDLNPTSTYAEYKLIAEYKLKELFKEDKSRLGIIRVFSVLDWDVPDFTLGGAIKKLTDPNSSFVLQNSDDVRDFLTPKLIAKSLFEIAVSGEFNGVTNLCTGVGTSVGDAATKMLRARNLAPDLSRIQRGQSSNPYVVGDNGRLKAALPHLKLTWNPF